MLCLFDYCMHCVPVDPSRAGSTGLDVVSSNEELKLIGFQYDRELKNPPLTTRSMSLCTKQQC